MPEPAVLAQPDTEVREPAHISEDQVSGSDTVLGTHRRLTRAGLSASDDDQPFMLGEVTKVLRVECRKRKIIDQAAGGYPGVVVWPGPSPQLRR